MAIKIFHRDDATIRVPMISNDARLIIWPGMGAQAITMSYVVLEPGEENIPHEHPDSEDVLFVVDGGGSAQDHSSGETKVFRAGDAVFIPPGLRHAIVADRGLPIESVGGPTPPDLMMLERSGVEI